MDPFLDPQVQQLPIDDAKEGVSLNVAESFDSENDSATPSPSMLSAEGNTPPLSPTTPSPLKDIPQFYFKHGRPPSDDIKQRLLSRIHQYFHDHSDKLSVQDFKTVTKEICNLPSFFCGALFRRIDTEYFGIITRDDFIEFWVNSNLMAMDKATQVYRILKQADQNYVTKTDFKPILEELLETHPYLKFLQNAPLFKKRYEQFGEKLIKKNSNPLVPSSSGAETVIYTIFYYVNKAGNGLITLRDLKHGNIIAALQQVDEEKDLDKLGLRYFSYKHFYVLYCKFCKLDFDYDFTLDKYDLMRYGNNALTSRILGRIFSQIPRKFSCEIEGKMGYEDFVYFMLAEEDKFSEPSVEYWFKCIDLGGNGVITRNELRFFYEEQLHRLDCMEQEPLLFENILCQISDMIRPKNGHFFTLRDFKECRLSGAVFDMLFNVGKFLGCGATHDSCVVKRMRKNHPTITEWDIFAFKEYHLLIQNRIEEGVDTNTIDDEVAALY